MKMVVIMYLEEDESIVLGLLREHEIASFSSLELEGHGAGSPGWYGEVAPFESRMVFVVLDDARAGKLLGAVRTARGISDPEHPIRAVQLAVEETAHCGVSEGQDPQ